jgi:hypothetical protein
MGCALLAAAALQLLLCRAAGGSPLSSAELALAAAAAAGVPAGHNLSVSPAAFPLAGGVAAAVTFVGAAVNSSAELLCRVESLPGLPLTMHFVRGGYRGPSFVDFPAVLTSATTLSCTPPAVVVPGAALLSFIVNTTGATRSDTVPITYETMADAVSHGLYIVLRTSAESGHIFNRKKQWRGCSFLKHLLVV